LAILFIYQYVVRFPNPFLHIVRHHLPVFIVVPKRGNSDL